jgi:hypothetical protein
MHRALQALELGPQLPVLALEGGRSPSFRDEILRQPAQRGADLFAGDAHGAASVASHAALGNEAGTNPARVWAPLRP